MRKHVIIINTSRGEIVQTDDLVQALNEGKVFGAALDVFEGEKAFIFKVGPLLKLFIDRKGKILRVIHLKD